MAKLNAPLFSFGASGKLAKSLVFFGWKGLDVVRSWVIPSNPKSSGQTTQRGYLSAAVAKIHACQALSSHPLDEDDQTAYALLGSTRATPRTWFNEVVRLWCDCKVASDIPIVYTDGRAVDSTANSVNLGVMINEETGSQLAAGKFYCGKTKTSLIHQYTGTIAAGVQAYIEDEDMSGWLTAGDKAYWQFRPDSGDPCEGADTGIYTFVAT